MVNVTNKIINEQHLIKYLILNFFFILKFFISVILISLSTVSFQRRLIGDPPRDHAACEIFIFLHFVLWYSFSLQI